MKSEILKHDANSDSKMDDNDEAFESFLSFVSKMFIPGYLEVYDSHPSQRS